MAGRSSRAAVTETGHVGKNHRTHLGLFEQPAHITHLSWVWRGIAAALRSPMSEPFGLWPCPSGWAEFEVTRREDAAS